MGFSWRESSPALLYKGRSLYGVQRLKMEEFPPFVKGVRGILLSWCKSPLAPLYERGELICVSPLAFVWLFVPSQKLFGKLFLFLKEFADY